MHIDEYLSHAGKKGTKWGYSRGQLVDSSKVAKGESASSQEQNSSGLVDRVTSSINTKINNIQKSLSDTADAFGTIPENKVFKAIKQAENVYNDITKSISDSWNNVADYVRGQEDRFLSEKQIAAIDRKLGQSLLKTKTELAKQAFSIYDKVADTKDKVTDILGINDRTETQKCVASMQRDILKQGYRFADKISDTTIKVGNFKKDTTDKVSNFVNKMALAMDHKSAVKPVPKSKTERAAKKFSNIFDKASDKMGPAIKAAKGVAKDAKAATRELKFTIGRTIDDVFNTKRKQKITALGRR